LPNRYSWIDFLVRRLSSRLHRHDFRYTRSQIDRLLSSVPALEICECRRYGLLPRLPWQAAPSWLGNARPIASTYRALDDAGSALIPWLTQNFYFIGVKR
jgi:hypothetical protein